MPFSLKRSFGISQLFSVFCGSLVEQGCLEDCATFWYICFQFYPPTVYYICLPVFDLRIF